MASLVAAFEFVIKRAAVDAEEFGGLDLIAADGGERARDVAAFDVGEGGGREVVSGGSGFAVACAADV